MNIRFLHTSDFQLGMTRWFLSGEDEGAQERFASDRLAAVRRLGEIAKERDCAFIVVAGDVFEHNSLAPKTTGRALEVLRQLPVPVYLMSGNHDPLTADSVFYRAQEIEGVHVLADSTPVQVETAPHVELVGAPLLSKVPSEDLVAASLRHLEPAENTIRIAVGHGAVEGFGDTTNTALIDLNAVEERIAEGVIDYLALGDTHSTQALGTSGKVWYSGSPETTDFHKLGEGGRGEFASGNALVVEIEKRVGGVHGSSTVSVEVVPVGKWTFESIVAEVNHFNDVEDFLQQLRDYKFKETTVVKYALIGSLDLRSMRHLQEGIEELRPVFAALYERQRLMDLMIEPGEEELEEFGLSGFAATTLEQLRELARTGNGNEMIGRVDAKGAETAKDAINLLFRLSSGLDYGISSETRGVGGVVGGGASVSAQKAGR
ncbi:DNA repair exonuclease [Corynebacterium sp. 153RC1]|uniref:metallophosphoesterase family protein n=1 Tax=unclassified Corynebacterium TaxID=2624378 RepID=UPI00211BE65E|nr:MULTISPECIES: DNA repair exonuclease [unclassified Corynebacterium]MCQ9369887.1 DNA repair exonuclease [Corynebacterium sp. 35RC1]MCQ9352006.1 DNA repair exonuclease [Corynebacterium sp. 209RC1]MCQ9353755.1 DNA repair exonuclease [Corynebacterium sp. 1222RC1]MCQ9356261.1 DNA repair exonuclease [Corynebacterium sp. 122RC1]MCQ9358363.1 DNA repair exonuclease [Corynebacterium sp. 142RC1]